jgi:uncharacterized protein (TIGR02266 family)
MGECRGFAKGRGRAMEDGAGQRSGIEQREDPRAAVRTEVRISYPDLSRLTREICSNVSVGGMFVEMPAPPEVGTEVAFELDLPGRRPRTIQGRGEIVWRRTAHASATQPSGCGVRFVELDARFRELVFLVVDRFIQGGGEPFDLDAG